MTENHSAKYSIRVQTAVYGTGFFNGTTQTMATMIVALMLAGLFSDQLLFLIGLIIAARQFLTVSMSIYGGALMDRYGTRKIMIFFGFIGAIAALIYPLFTEGIGPFPETKILNPGLGLVAGLILVQMISGYSEAMTWIGSQALVGQLMKGNPVYAGRMTFVARIGGFLGPPAVGIFWDSYGMWGAFSFLSLWILGGLLAAIFLPRITPQKPDENPEPTTSESNKRKTGKSDYGTTLRLLLIPAIALVIMITVMRQTGSGVQSSFYVVWLRDEIELSGQLIGWLLGGANAASAIAALGMGPLTTHFSNHWALIVMIVLSIIGIAITPALGDIYILLMMAICLRGAAQGLNLPLMMTIMAQNVGLNLQARVTALRITFNRFGGMIIPPIMGGLAELVGLGNSFYIIGSVGLFGILLLSFWVARSPSFKN